MNFRWIFSIALGLSACAPRLLDLGTTDGGPVPTASEDAAPIENDYGCVSTTDTDLATLRGETCAGACTVSGADAYALDTQKTLVAATSGEWLFCGASSLGPATAIGVEFAPGCRLFFLRRDASGSIVRGTESDDQASYDIYDLRSPAAPRKIDVHLNDGRTVAYDVAVTHCPNELTLVDPLGNRLVLGSDFGDAGRPNPVK